MMSRTYAFIDAANLFYGGEKSLGWKINYKKLLNYLRKKYKIKYLQSEKRMIKILARGERSAKEIKQLAGSDFRDFHKLRSRIEFK